MARKKVCLVFAGGTIGMKLDPELKTLKPVSSGLELVEDVPELQNVADIDFEMVVNIDSSNMQPAHWSKISTRIYELYDHYDGFVVAHGTDTMSYTASALSYALQNIGKPIVFTGSLIPMAELGSDARNNLVYACMTATLDLAEVCVVMANKIFRGNRARKRHESFVAAFHSPNYPFLGVLGRPITVYDWTKKRHDGKLLCKSDFSPNISLLKLFPGFDPDIFDHVVRRGVGGIMLEGFGPGNVPIAENSIIPKIEMAIKKQIPVVIGNQMEKGTTNLASYEAGLYAQEAGAVSAKDMTTEAAVTKLMWALGQEMDFDEIREIIGKDFAGEVTEGGAQLSPASVSSVL